MMRKILIITGRYLPGWRDGGPVRSVLNLTEWLGDEYDIRIMCLDRDHGDTERYPGIRTGEYTRVGKADVWYTDAFDANRIRDLAGDCDVVYVCGVYNDYARIAMGLKKSGKIKAPLFVASMGSFSPEAFRIKGLKKKVYIICMKMMRMFDGITWSVTSEREEKELKAVVGGGVKCVIAADLPRRGVTSHTYTKEENRLKLCFVSRISRKKNLALIPDILKKADTDCHIHLDVYGHAEDENYFRECSKSLDELAKVRPGFTWEYRGEANSEEVPAIFADHDAFLFPTLGENYGHVIAESLAAGCVPVISDTTPWLDLDRQGCGYVCSPGDAASFARSVSELAGMSPEQIRTMQERCRDYISSVNNDSVTSSGYRAIFNSR